MIKGLHYVRSARRGGPVRWYVYAWRGGPCIHKAVGKGKPLLGPNELRRIQAALNEARPQDPDILRSLISSWRLSPEWQSLSDGTKRTWGSALVRIEEKWGETPLVIWSDPRMTAKVVAWRDSRSDTARAADIGVMVLKALLEFGRLRAKVSINVAAGIPTLYRNGQRAEIIWTKDDMDRFANCATRIGYGHVVDGLRLAALTGLRREDLITLTWDQVTDVAIVKRTLKRSARKRRHMTMPRIPALDQLLEELRGRPRKDGVNTVLVNSHGRPWTGNGFGGCFNKVRDEAGIVHVDAETGEKVKKHLHDVRGTFCTQLLTKADLSEHQIAEIMGWSTERVTAIRRLYVDQSAVISALGKRLRRIA